MFEGLVKRMLDTYLAPYVEGITQNLQMAVWSGNISLENLTLKNDIVSRLALPFHDVSGKIGSMNIRIPWTSLGTTPIRIVIDSVYICIDNRSNEKTDEEILAHLRKKKNNLISILEHEYFELANLQSEGKLSSSYIIKLSQKILNNIQIDFTNIHLQFFDEHSSFAFKIDSIFVRKSKADETKKSLRLKTNEEFREEPVTHVCSLLGLSIYETNFNLKKNEISSNNILQLIINHSEEKKSENGEGMNDYIGLLMLEPLSFRLYLAINARNKSIYASLCIGSIDPGHSKISETVINYTNYIKSNISNLTNKVSTNRESNVSARDDKVDRLKIVLTSDVIRTFTKMWVDINMVRKRGKRILLSKSNEVKLDPESLQTSTKAEFIKLYTKYKLTTSSGLGTPNDTHNTEMDKEESERLQDIIDLVPARYIARWKFACKRRSSATVMTKENKSWFKWAKNIVTTTYNNYQSGKQNQETSDSNKNEPQQEKEPRKSFRQSLFSLNNSFIPGKIENKPEQQNPVQNEEKNEILEKVIVENLPGGLVLTEDEIKMIQETISLEELFDDSFTTSSYYFESVLPSFQFIVQLIPNINSSAEEEIIVVDIQNLQSRLYLHAVMDMKDKDRYEGYFDLNLDSFDVIMRDKKIMTFSQQNIPFQSIVDTYIDPSDMLMVTNTSEKLELPESNHKLELCQSITVTERCIMNLRIYHRIMEKGNVVVVNGELRPIETNLFPELIPVFFDLVSLFNPIKQIFNEDFSVDAYNTNLTGPSTDKEVEYDELTSELNPDELLSDRELEHLPSAEVDKIQFVNFDIKFSAPILIIYFEDKRIDFYFGTLLLKSNGDCPIGHIDGTLELKQTQITCNYMDKSYNFLRPLPVKIHYDVDMKKEQINLNVIFEEIFAQLEPMATNILFKVPNEIIKILLNNMDGSQKSNVNGTDEIADTNISQVRNKLKQYKISSNVLIRHSGFSVSNLNLHEIFKLDMYNVAVKMSYTLLNFKFSLSMESFIISNPTTKIPLFKTKNTLPPYTDVEPTLDSLNITQYPSQSEKQEKDGAEDLLASVKRMSSLERVEDEYVDAIEDVSKSLDLEISTNIDENQIHNEVNAQIIEMEGNWEYSTIKLIVDCFQEYKDIFSNHISVNTITSLTTTFKNFKDKFIFPNTSSFVNQTDDVKPNPENLDNSSSKCSENIEGFLIDDELPMLGSELKRHEIVTKCKLIIKGASVLFNNSNGDVIAKLSVGKIRFKLYKFQNDEKIIKLSIQTGRLYFGGRCILSHLINYEPKSDANLDSISDNQSDEVEVQNNLLELKLKCYNTKEVPYSICFQGKVDRVVFVYFQHDINRFLEYFDDGILSVFLSKSYHRVVQRADEIYFFYHFSITSPIFILPENKAAIPDCKVHYKQTIPPGSTLPLYDTDKREYENNEVDNEGVSYFMNISNVVDLWYFGSYILFELGHLEFRNSYSKLFESYKSTIFLKMLGTKAQIMEQKNGTPNISGVILDPTDLKVCTRGRDLMEIGIDSKALVTNLTRNQMTFVIDVFNENIGGASYMVNKSETNNFTQNFPTKSESRYLIRLSINKFQFYCYNNSSNTSTTNVQNNSTIIPLGLFEFEDITCCLDYASNNVKLVSYYQFGFISKSLTITDLRVNSFNKYKTLLKCNNEGEFSAEDMIMLEEETNIVKSVNGLLFEWLKNYKTKTGNDFFKIDPSNFTKKAKTHQSGVSVDNSYLEGGDSETKLQYHGIKCVIVTDPEESFIDVIVSKSEIPLLFVYFFDIVRFFSLSYGTSSMALFPKISQVNIERVYILNLLVSKSKFISFSKMDKLDSPRLELVTDFILQMHVHGNSFKFTKLDIIDCLLSRVYPNTNIKQVLCGNFLMYGKGHYLSEVSSKMFFQFTIPQINLILYTRDLSIIIYCFKSMFTDGPSVIPIKLVNNQLIDDNTSKFLTLSFDIKGIEMMFYDDLKKSIVPLVKFTVESEKLEIINLPIEKRYSLIRCNCHLYYFNTNVGDWEPFIEKFIFNLEYITNPTGNSVDLIKKNRLSSQINKPNRVTDDNTWKDFVAEYQLKITCNNNLLVNITPNLCQLLQYFLPILKSNLQSPCLNNPNNINQLENEVINVNEETKLNDMDSLESVGGSKKMVEEDDIEMYNYRYINLTNYEYYGFIMDLNKSRTEAFSDVMNIVTTTNPKQLDSLVNQLHKEVSSNDYCIHLITKPPKYLLKHLSKELNCSEQLIETDLLTTTSVFRTISNLSSISSHGFNKHNAYKMNKSALFNNGTVLSNIPLSKNCTVLLSVPVKDIKMYNLAEKNMGELEKVQDDENSDVLTNMVSINSTENTSNESTTPMDLNSNRPSSVLNSNRPSSVVGVQNNIGRFSNLNVETNTTGMGTEVMGMSRSNRVTNVANTAPKNNLICQVLTPHPSHKLLLFTSTVRIYNKSGMPIVMCFLDRNYNQQYMYNLNHRTIPCNLLNQSNMDNFKQYTTNNIYTGLSEVQKHTQNKGIEDQDGYCVVIPNDYMLSVPENVFITDSQTIFSFKPLYRHSFDIFSPSKADFRSKSGENLLKGDYSKLVNKSGWSKLIDTSHHVGTRLRQCYCPELTKNGFIYFVVSVNHKRSSLPANVNVSEVVIYPSISVMNTLPLDLDLKLLYKDYNLNSSKYGGKDEHNTRKEEVVYKLNNKSILHIYSVPPNESLSLYLKLCKTEKPYSGRGNNRDIGFSTDWCTRIDNIYGNSDTKTTFNMMVNSSLLELELIRFPGALPVNNLCIQGHLSLIVNAPWLFIDRTGLSLVPQHFNRIYTTNNLSFLYDNNNNNYKLISLNNPVQSTGRHARYSDLRTPSGPRYSSTSTHIHERSEDFIDENEYDIKMPIIGGYVYTTIDIKGKNHCVCLITEKVYIPGLSHISSKVTSALPEYLFTNNLQEPVHLRKDSRTQSMQILPNSTQSISHLTNFINGASPASVNREGAKEDTSENYIEIKVGMETCWSNVIYLNEIYSGETFMSLPKENSSKSLVYNITIIPKNGIKYISINPIVTPTPTMLTPGDKDNDIRGYLLYNNCSVIKVVMIRTFHKSDIRNGSCFTAKYGQVVNFGWPNPFVHKTKLIQVLLWLDKNTVAPSKPLIFNFSTPSFRYRRIELTTPEYHTNYSITILAENRIDYYIIIINPCENLNITNPLNSSDSLSKKETEKTDVEEIDDSILLQDGNNLKDSKEEDLQVFEEVIKSYQVILQINQIGVSIVSQSLHEELFFLEMGGIMSLFMCKEDNQRLELKIFDVQLDNQSDSEIGRTILVNRSKVETKDTSFLQVYIDRPFSNCKDISIKKMFISLDDLQVDFNDLLFTKIFNYYRECMINLNNYSGHGYDFSNDKMEIGNKMSKFDNKINIDMIEKWLNMENDSPTSSIDVNVKLPRSISIDYLYIEAFNLVVWCCFELDKLHMLGDLLRVGIRILSVSRNFQLMGAPLSFQREYISVNRTSIFTFYEQMKEKYLQACLSSIVSILGYSNLLNIPKLPITVGKCTIELAVDAVDSFSSGLSMFLSKFTFDKEYIKRRTTTKDVTSIKDGIFSAGKSIGEGLFSLTNIVTKPIEGAQKEGVGGFIKGLGKGIVGSIVKPIDKVGLAVSQVSRGIKANINKEEKYAVEPCRKPRMLWGEFSQIRTYSTVDAEIKYVLGSKYSKYIMDCLVILKQVNNGKYIALLFYPSKIYLVDLINNPNQGKKPYTMWKLLISKITDVRASSHGVIIKCGTEQYQVPCTRAEMINNIYSCFQRAIKHSSSQITIGPELFAN
uniref:N-terminal region of Chorein, a TM vesicle-mediated sorter, putative n=1 Tax=Theileria annulata TaxID=5874 RepID=A0A3B0MVM0_THEAN